MSISYLCATTLLLAASFTTAMQRSMSISRSDTHSEAHSSGGSTASSGPRLPHGNLHYSFFAHNHDGAQSPGSSSGRVHGGEATSSGAQWHGRSESPHPRSSDIMPQNPPSSRKRERGPSPEGSSSGDMTDPRPKVARTLRRVGRIKMLGGQEPHAVEAPSVEKQHKEGKAMKRADSAPSLIGTRTRFPKGRLHLALRNMRQPGRMEVDSPRSDHPGVQAVNSRPASPAPSGGTDLAARLAGMTVSPTAEHHSHMSQSASPVRRLQKRSAMESLPVKTGNLKTLHREGYFEANPQRWVDNTGFSSQTKSGDSGGSKKRRAEGYGTGSERSSGYASEEEVSSGASSRKAISPSTSPSHSRSPERAERRGAGVQAVGAGSVQPHSPTKAQDTPNHALNHALARAHIQELSGPRTQQQASAGSRPLPSASRAQQPEQGHVRGTQPQRSGPPHPRLRKRSTHGSGGLEDADRIGSSIIRPPTPPPRPGKRSFDGTAAEKDKFEGQRNFTVDDNRERQKRRSNNIGKIDMRNEVRKTTTEPATAMHWTPSPAQHPAHDGFASLTEGLKAMAIINRPKA